jgi:hypothetical protein
MRPEDWDQSARYVLVHFLHASHLVSSFGRLDSGMQGRSSLQIRLTLWFGLFDRYW